VKRKRAGPGLWLVALVCMLALFMSGDVARSEPLAVSGEFGALTQIGNTSPDDCGWFGRESGFSADKRPAELFGSLRLDGGPGSAALCLDGRHTLRRSDWLAWEDRLAVRAELPLSPNLMAIAGWEQRYRIGESRFVAGAKLTFGGRGHD
jgi:hypothetical protein